MANSKFEYTRQFEREEYLLPNTWIVVRIDGRGFHKISRHYDFVKPNDVRALNLMNAAAQHVLHAIPDVAIGYGHSDEYSFVFHRSCSLFERRAAKIASTVVSTFTAAYVHLWPLHFSTPPLGDTFYAAAQATPHENSHERDESKVERLSGLLDVSLLPTFDARCISYPSNTNLRDYLSWRQVDCHVNNLYNTTFWALVLKGGMSNSEAEEFLKGTLSSDKNEILWSRFNVNYNDEQEIFKKGSVVLRQYRLVDVEGAALPDEEAPGLGEQLLSGTQKEKMKKARQKAQIVVQHTDIIKDDFWLQRPWLLSGLPGKSLPQA